MRVLKKAARIQRRQHTSTRRAEKGHSLEFVCWCTTERYSGYLAGDCEFETRFLRQSVRLPWRNRGPGTRPSEGLVAASSWKTTILSSGVRVGDAYRAGARSRAEGVRYGVTAADHNIARPPILLASTSPQQCVGRSVSSKPTRTHARGRGMAQNRVAATHPARDRWFESIFLLRRVIQIRSGRQISRTGSGKPQTIMRQEAFQHRRYRADASVSSINRLFSANCGNGGRVPGRGANFLPESGL